MLQARESEEQNRRVRDEKEVVLKQLQKLKSQMNRARAKARSNLAKLTKESSATLKALEHVVGKVGSSVTNSGHSWFEIISSQRVMTRGGGGQGKAGL